MNRINLQPDFKARTLFHLALAMLLLIGNSTGVLGQVLNLDREDGKDSLITKSQVLLTGNFSSDKQKNNLVEFGHVLEAERILKNHYFLVLLNQSDISLNGNRTLENNGYLQLRYRDKDTRSISPELYSQYQWNGVLGLERRTSLGSNVRLRFLERNNMDIYCALGGFYEMENWNTAIKNYQYKSDIQQKVNRNLVRLNLVNKIAFKISQRVDFNCISYLQFPMNGNFNKPRWYFDSNLYMELSEKANFLIHYDHNFDAYRALPIDKYYYSINLGFQLKLG